MGTGSFVKRNLFQHKYKILTGFLCLLVICCSVVFISYYIFQYYYNIIPDTLIRYDFKQIINARVKDKLPVDVILDDILPIRLNKKIAVKLPINEDIKVLIDDDFQIPVDQTFQIPIDQVFHITTTVPVDIKIKLENIKVKTKVLGLFNITVPINGEFPVKAEIPLDTDVRVSTVVNYRLNELIKVHLKKIIILPLKLNIDTKLPLNDIFDIKLPEKLKCSAEIHDLIPVKVHLNMTVSKKGEITIR